MTAPPTNAPLPDRFYEGFPGIAKELLAARRGSPPQTPPSLTVSTKVFRGLPRNRPPPGAENFYMFRKSQHIFAKKIKKFQTQAAKAVEKTASADRKPRISRG